MAPGGRLLSGPPDSKTHLSSMGNAKKVQVLRSKSSDDIELCMMAQNNGNNILYTIRQ